MESLSIELQCHCFINKMQRGMEISKCSMQPHAEDWKLDFPGCIKEKATEFSFQKFLASQPLPPSPASPKRTVKRSRHVDTQQWFTKYARTDHEIFRSRLFPVPDPEDSDDEDSWLYTSFIVW
jgi:hypothetical protein